MNRKKVKNNLIKNANKNNLVKQKTPIKKNSIKNVNYFLVDIFFKLIF